MIDDFIRVSAKDLQSMAFTSSQLETILLLIDFYIKVGQSVMGKYSDEELRNLRVLKAQCVNLLTKGEINARSYN